MRISFYRSSRYFAALVAAITAVAGADTLADAEDQEGAELHAASSLVVVASADGEPTTAPAAAPAEERARPSVAAREILKLRRAVGLNPIAGTMFDSAARDATWVGDVSPQAETDEQTITAKIHELESEESAAAQVTDGLQNCPQGEMPNPWTVQLLRPAERRLEEAAEMLEEAGQYERADAARALAQEIRHDARKLETQRPPVSIPSTLIYGPHAGR